MLNHRWPRITKMAVKAEANGIILDFPEVEPSKDIELLTMLQNGEPLKRNGGAEVGSTRDPLYLSHRGEDTGILAPQFRPTEAEYYESYHPTEVSLVAFNEHHGFTLAPENVVAQLLLDLGEYVHCNPDRCASIFGGEVGKKTELKVWLNPGESFKTPEIFFRTIREWAAGVRKQTDGAIRDVLHPKLSTATPETDAVLDGLLMGSAKDFFEFLWGTRCGIPRIRVAGTKEDWEQVRALVTGLGRLGQVEENLRAYYAWADETVMDGILGIYSGREDVQFWTSLVRHDSGSGSEGASSGWLPSMNLYGKKNSLLPMQSRWTPAGKAYQCRHLTVAAADVLLISDSREGVPNIDPSLATYIGFTSANTKDGMLKPVLGIDAFAVPQADRK